MSLFYKDWARGGVREVHVLDVQFEQGFSSEQGNPGFLSLSFLTAPKYSSTVPFFFFLFTMKFVF